MSSVVEIKLGPEVPKMIEVFGNSAGLRRAIAREMDLQTQLTVGHIVATRLVGKGPFPVEAHRLGERSHKLRQSLRGTKAVIAGDVISTSIGSNLKYAGIHEFGFQGTVMVGGHVRKRSVNRWLLGAEPKRAEFKKPKRIKGEKAQDYAERIAQAQSDFYVEQNLNSTGRSQRRLVQKKVRVGDSTVRTHSRQVNIPARAPITTGIQDRAAAIGAGLTRAIVDFYTQKNGGQP